MKKFNSTFKYKLIYVFRINDEAHEGLLKIGEATVHSDKSYDNLPPNCNELNQSAKNRIDNYTKTAAIIYDIIYTEIAVYKNDNDRLVGFFDRNVHNVLKNSGIEKAKIGNTKANEWYKTDLETVKNAIMAVKQDRKSLLPYEKTFDKSPIILRPSQEDAIERTINNFKKNDRMLWNAKMRFGKTLAALEVIKRQGYKKTIIITHRPVVHNDWKNDFDKTFYDIKDYKFGSKASNVTVKDLEKENKNIVYFASVQDLRGSSDVGGNFDKNDDIFETNWDFVIIDEAHEGTTTELGQSVIDKVFSKVKKDKSKLLELSGTPFNIIGEYKDDKMIYSWDYVKEQAEKENWYKTNIGEPNPYADLPKLNIFTYDLGKALNVTTYQTLQDKAFNFREFFRVWTGNLARDFKPIPTGSKIGDFVHQDDVISFLNLITKTSSDSNYPYSKNEYRELFKHSLWMIPGVKEAKALSSLMKSHHIFGSGSFEIINIAGDGDEDESSENARIKVENGIKSADKDGRYTITLSCGKMTTGVTIKEWTAVMMLSGSYSTSAANYLQTIFRVQSPANIDGKIKENGFVFDFAPDRTLKVVTEALKLSSKVGQTSETDRIMLGEFLNFCPVIAIDGSEMKNYDTDKMLQELKKIYVNKAIETGFDDTSIYNNLELDKLTKDDLSMFDELNKIVSASKPTKKADSVDIANNGLTAEQRKELENLEQKGKKELSEKDKERIKELNERKSQKKKVISNLRAVTTRIPLLIYGININLEKDITFDTLLDPKLVDDESWTEFMPKDLTREMFRKLTKYYDVDVFIAAGNRIRNMVRNADNFDPLERVFEITKLFSYFKNPDKETVLTPWRVVNMHMVDCFGGYNFYDEDCESILEEPILVDKGDITKELFDSNGTQILEINSKTGLYPLWVTFTIFMYKLNKSNDFSKENQEKIWLETVEKNLFVLCKTEMARLITQRTLLGFKSQAINAKHITNLVDTLRKEPHKVIEKVSEKSYWIKGEQGKMKFDAIVGNPPYMEMDGGAQASAKPIYQNFVENSKKLNPNFLSMIIPTRWYAGGKGLDEFRDIMLNDINLMELHDFTNPEQLFPNTNIRGGVCYFLWNKDYNNKTDLVRVVSHSKASVDQIMRPMKIDGSDIFIRDFRAVKILDKVTNTDGFTTISQHISARKPFGLEGYFTKDKRFKSTSEGLDNYTVCYGKGQQIGYVERNIITVNTNRVDSWKVYIPRANNIGTELNDDNLNAFVGKPNTICTESYLCVGADLELNELSAENLSKYLKTKFVRYLHSLAKASQDATSKTFKFVPTQDFSTKWTDKGLYAKYNLSQEEIDFIESMIKPME